MYTAKELQDRYKMNSKQAFLKYVREYLDIINKDGRPITKDKVVIAWRQQHPSGNKADCIRDTGLSRPTVAKYWNIKV